MKNISIAGSGAMGNGIAHVFAQNKHQVSLIDVSEKALGKAIATIGKNLDRQVRKGTITTEDKEAALNRITVFTSIEEGTKNADLIIEAVTENIQTKQDLFKKNGQHRP